MRDKVSAGTQNMRQLDWVLVSKVQVPGLVSENQPSCLTMFLKHHVCNLRVKVPVGFQHMRQIERGFGLHRSGPGPDVYHQPA